MHLIYSIWLRVLTRKVTELTTIVTFGIFLTSIVRLLWRRALFIGGEEAPSFFELSTLGATFLLFEAWVIPFFCLWLCQNEIDSALWLGCRVFFQHLHLKFINNHALLIRSIGVHSNVMHIFSISSIRRQVKQSNSLSFIQVGLTSLSKFVKHELRVKKCFSNPFLLMHFSLLTFNSRAQSLVSDKILYIFCKVTHMDFAEGRSLYKQIRSLAMHDIMRYRVLRSFLRSLECCLSQLHPFHTEVWPSRW